MFVSFFADASRLWAAAFVLLQVLCCAVVHATVECWGQAAYEAREAFCQGHDDGTQLSSLNTTGLTCLARFFQTIGKTACNFQNLTNLDISKWDVSSVTDMRVMFGDSPFNGDISKWDVSSVTDMTSMFYKSQFNGDISKWDVSSVTRMWSMFYESQFNGDISKWDVSSVTDMRGMFYESQFNGDISKWDVSSVTKMRGIFKRASSAAGLLKQTVLWNTATLRVASQLEDQPCPDSTLEKNHSQATQKGTLEARCPGWWAVNDCNEKKCTPCYDVITDTVHPHGCPARGSQGDTKAVLLGVGLGLVCMMVAGTITCAVVYAKYRARSHARPHKTEDAGMDTEPGVELAGAVHVHSHKTEDAGMDTEPGVELAGAVHVHSHKIGEGGFP